jgi:hypothetical protein
MDLAWMVAAAVASVLASWAFNALLHLVWRPYAITRSLRAQGVRGPDYRFLTGNLAEMKRLRADGAAVTLDVGDHDFIPMVQPHHRKWISLYGTSVTRPSIAISSFDATLEAPSITLLTVMFALLQAGRSCTGTARRRTCAWRT